MTSARAHTNSPAPVRSGRWLGGLVILGAALRGWRLAAQPLWMDEVASFRNAQVVRADGLMAVAKVDHVPPLSSALEALSMWIGRGSEFWMRLPAALAGTIAIALTYVVAQRLLGDRSISLASAGVVAVAPFAVWYSQEGRMYSLLMVCGLVYVICGWAVVGGVARRWEWAGAVLSAVAGLWTHPYMILLMICLSAYVLARRGWRDRTVWWWATINAVAVLAFVPWLVASAGQANTTGFGKSGRVFWLPYTLYTFVGGHSIGPSVRDMRLLGTGPAVRQHVGAVAVVAVAVAALLLAAAPRLWRRSAPVSWWLAVWLFGPIVLAILATVPSDLSFNPRYAITAFPAFAIVSGAVISAVRRDRLSMGVAALAGVVVALALRNWYTDAYYAKDDLRGPARVLEQSMGPGDHLIIDNATAVGPMSHYGWRCQPSDVAVRTQAGATAAASAVRQRRGTGVTWLLVYRPWETDVAGALPAALAETGAKRVGAWPGSELFSADGVADLVDSPGLSLGCTSS